jgi:hypothetical protein
MVAWKLPTPFGDVPGPGAKVPVSDVGLSLFTVQPLPFPDTTMTPALAQTANSAKSSIVLSNFIAFPLLLFLEKFSYTRNVFQTNNSPGMKTTLPPPLPSAIH